ncbi:MAG: adenylate/guanylate cyclase domain-containing protein [Alphaproteobacteria bacterium]
MDVDRKLTTILATDVVGFSDMMGRDEAGTLEILKTCSLIIEDCISRYKGRVFGGAGDSLIAEFSSPLSAVLCAHEFQQSMSDRNLEVTPPQRMRFRAGINMADLLVDGENLYGEGVNIAARLEAVGEPGGLCISEKVYEEIRRNTDLPFVDGGAPALKNIGRPVRVFHLRLGQEATPAEPDKPTAAPLPSRKSARKVLVVRPFKVPGDDEAAFLADGLREGLLDSLSKQTAVSVLRQQPDADDEAAFALQGSVRMLGERVRLTFSLVEAASNQQLWSERYDRQSADVFALEDEISRTVAGIVRVKLKVAQFERLRDAEDDGLSMPDLLDKAAAYLVHSPGDNDRITATLRLALEREPDNSMAHAMLGYCLYRDLEFSPLAPAAEVEATIVEHVDRAVSLKADNYFARLVAGVIAQDLQGDFERGMWHAQAALQANPELTPAHGLIGIARCHMDDVEAGIAVLKDAMSGGREDPHRFRHQRELALATFVAGDVVTSIELMNQLVGTEPGLARNHLVLAALRWLGGDADTAVTAGQGLLATYPELSMRSRRRTCFGQAQTAAAFDEALVAIGLPA